MPWQLEHSYTKLNKDLFSHCMPTATGTEAQLALWNSNIATELNLSDLAEDKQRLAAELSGNAAINGAQYIAQAYAGHQFGHFTMLGDGRALLVGEQIGIDNQRYDIQLKGAGPTPYSRNGDGRCTLSAALREYIMSEALHHLRIPTTRSLAVCITGGNVYRNYVHQGAVLTRIAKSHLRVGTFEYAHRFCSKETLQQLCDYALQRHFKSHTQNAISLLQHVITQQVNLIVEWCRIGFIHGVMNTDNMSICGETIDYGPCAFMNKFNPESVYSQIDQQGRYAFGNQPSMMHFNLSRFAETLLALISDEKETAVGIAQELLDEAVEEFEEKWTSMMLRKIGIMQKKEGDEQLLSDLLKTMLQQEQDYTNTFYYLASDKNFEDTKMEIWRNAWLQRHGGFISEDATKLMQHHNPSLIPRNHLVEQCLTQACEQNDFSYLQRMLSVWANPYNYNNVPQGLQEVPKGFDESYYTHCNT